MTNEQMERINEKRKELLTKGLTTRQYRLKDWLKEHFQSGHYFSIEEIVDGFRDKDGNPYYTLNTNPRIHDKCVCLSNDIRAINFNITERFIPIIKDKKGGCKLAENKTEVDNYIDYEREKVNTQYQYLQTLENKVSVDGFIPIINQANRVLAPEELKPIEAFMKDEKEN